MRVATFPAEMEWASLPSSSEHDVGLEMTGNHTDTQTSQNQGNVAGSGLPRLRKQLGFRDALGIVVGIMVGSGIFSSPGVALSAAQNPWICLLAWGVSGLLVATTALCYLELHSLYPYAGGDYSYLQAAYGDRSAFSFAWFNLLISKTGSQAIIATIFGRYCDQIWKYAQGGISATATLSATSEQMQETALSRSLAVCVIAGSTLLNCLSVRSSSSFQNALTVSKVICVGALFLVTVIVSVASPDSTRLSALSEEGSTCAAATASTTSGGFDHGFGFGSAMVAALWSFDGWCDPVFMTEELLSPASLPRIVLTAIFFVTALYLAMNTAYLMQLSCEQVVGSRAIGMALGDKINATLALPPALNPALLVALLVTISTMSSLNGSIMTGARAFYAVARDGKFPRVLERVNQAGAPWVALLVQGAWAVLLLLLPDSNFSSLLAYFGPCSWFFYAFTASGVIALRRRKQAGSLGGDGCTLPPPSSSSVAVDNKDNSGFRVPLYPAPPLVVMALASCIITASLVRFPFFTLLAFSVVLLSVPFHIIFLEQRGGGTPEELRQ